MRLEGGNVEYGPGQWEVNLAHDEALAAADQGVRLKYGVREMARREGVKATFMAKPFNKLSGSSMHLHVSLWKDGQPAFAPEDGAENPLMLQALGGLIRHLPGIALYGSPTVNSYKRFELDSFAPVNVSWGGDNRTRLDPVAGRVAERGADRAAHAGRRREPVLGGRRAC